ISQAVSSSDWTDYSSLTPIGDGLHNVTVSFTNDSFGGCDRNLRVDRVTFPSTGSPPSPPSPPTTSNPFAVAKLDVDPDSNPHHQADAWRSSRPADAAQMDKFANQPQAEWFGDFSGDISTAVGNTVSKIRAAGALPVLVAYNIPERDCGSFSAGGA